MAGRSIGSISVDVDANTGKLVAQLTKAGEEAGRAAKDAIDDQLGRIGGRDFTQRLLELRAEVEEAFESIEVELALQLPKREIVQFREQLEALLSGTTVTVGLDVAEGSLEAVQQEINAGLVGIEAEIGTDVNQTSLAATRAEIRAGVSGIDATIGVDVTRSQATIARWLAGQGGGGGGADDAGEAAADAFGKGFSSGLARFASHGALVSGAVLAAAQPAAVALEGAFGGAIAVISSAFSALAGTIGALPPIGAGVLTSVGALKIGLKGVSDALDGDADALAKLTPAARDFVEAFDGLRPAFDNLRRSVQERLFAGLDDELQRLARDSLPGIAVGLDAAADSLNSFFRDLADVVAGIDFAGLFEAIQPAVDELLDALVSVAATIEPFLRAAAPAARELAGFLADGAASLAEMVGANIDAISEFLTEGIDSLRSWAGLAGSIGGALTTLFGAGREAGDDFVDSLAGVIGRFDQWMESVEGQRALANFFADAKEIIGDLGPLIEGAADAFGKLVTPKAIDRFGKLADAIGDLLPKLADIADAIGPTVLGVVQGLADVFEVLAPIVSDLADALEPVPDLLLGAAAGFVVLKVAVGGGAIGTGIDAITAALGRLATAAAPWTGGGLGLALGAQLGQSFEGGPVDWGAVGEGFKGLVSGDVFTAKWWREEPGAGIEHVGKVMGPTIAAQAEFTDKTDELTGSLKFAQVVMALAAEGTEASTAASEENAAALKEQRERVEELAEAMTDWATETIQANNAMADIAGTFEQIGVKQDALSALFDLGNAPLDVAGEVRDIALAIDDLSETAKDVKVGDILAGNVKADKVLDAIDDMRPDIQKQINDAFSAGGTDAAAEMAHDYISQVADELGITDLDAAKLLGLENIEATIAVAMELSDVENARRQLEVLVGVGGETPYTASIALALDAGTISGDQAQALIQPKLDDHGVTIPGEIAVNTDPAILAAAEKALAAGITVPLSATPPSGHDLLALVNAGLAGLNIDPIALEAVPPSAAETKPLIDAALADLGLNPITAPVIGPLPADLQTAIDTVIAGVVPAALEVPLTLMPLSAATSASIDDIALGVSTVVPPVSVPMSLDTTVFDASMDDVTRGLKKVDDAVVTPTVTIPGISSTIGNVRTLDSLIRGLPNKTVTLTVKQVGGTGTLGKLGLPGLGGLMAGGMVDRPQIVRVGERGYREAIIPLQLPLNRISPDVRQLAALVRGEGPAGGSVPTIGKQVVVNQTITPSSADPATVAQQIVNRAAVLAR